MRRIGIRGEHCVRVLHVIPSVGPLRGGPSRVLRTMTRDLAEAGFDVHVATTDDNAHGRLEVSCGIPVVEEKATYTYFRRQTRFYNFSWPLSRWLAEHVENYDLVHIHGLFSFATTPAALFAEHHGIPYVIRPLGTLNRWGMRNCRPRLKALSFRFLERRLVAGAAAIHYTSEQERLEAAELGIVQRSVIIPNPVDTPLDRFRTPGLFRSRYPQLAGCKILLFLSRLDRKKGLDLLLPAFARVREQDPSAKLVLAGSGDPAFVAGLRAHAARLGIYSDVIWTDFLEGAEKWAALADADLFALPSYSENFGVAALEAMVCGRPVVVSDQVAIHREIATAEAGLVVPCRVGELAQALIRVLRSEALRSRMAENARRLAETQFSSRAVTCKLATLYADLLRPDAQAVIA